MNSNSNPNSSSNHKIVKWKNGKQKILKKNNTYALHKCYVIRINKYILGPSNRKKAKKKQKNAIVKLTSAIQGVRMDRTKKKNSWHFYVFLTNANLFYYLLPNGQSTVTDYDHFHNAQHIGPYEIRNDDTSKKDKRHRKGKNRFPIRLKMKYRFFIFISTINR